MFRRLLVMIVALSCFCGVGFAEDNNEDVNKYIPEGFVSGDMIYFEMLPDSFRVFEPQVRGEMVAVPFRRLDMFFKDGFNGFRFGDNVMKCGDSIEYEGPAYGATGAIMPGRFMYRRVDGYSYIGAFNNNDLDNIGGTYMVFEGYSPKFSRFSNYVERIYTNDGEGVIEYCKELWGEPESVVGTIDSGAIYYSWYGFKSEVSLGIAFKRNLPPSMNDVVIDLDVFLTFGRKYRWNHIRNF